MFVAGLPVRCLCSCFVTVGWVPYLVHAASLVAFWILGSCWIAFELGFFLMFVVFKVLCFIYCLLVGLLLNFGLF